VTALADVLAGFALAGLHDPRALPWLLVSTACLYAGGVTLNDYFDRDLDRLERPERPIPSGRVAPAHAATLGGLLLAAGVGSAAVASLSAGLVGAAIAAAVLVYDTRGKRHPVAGPLNMGLCRALNLLLGIAAAPHLLPERWVFGLIPLGYIAAVTAVSRGEVHGGRRQAATMALISLSAALAGLGMIVARSPEPVVAGAVLAVLCWRVLPAFLQARRSLEPGAMRHAVRRGVLSLVFVNAVIGTAYAGPVYGALILATGVAAGLLARVFAVT
jgi:4-hydroxybenzoate polyprenyltransferase